MSNTMLPPIMLAPVVSAQEQRNLLAELSAFNRGMRGAVEQSMRNGTQGVTCANSVENWMRLLQALEAAEIAFARTLVDGAKT